MSKYEPLRDFLKTQNRQFIRLTFSEIEKLIGTSLPASARKHRPWWSNNPSNSVITNAWLDAGYRSEQVDMENGTLVFRRAERTSPVSTDSNVGGPLNRHPLFGAMKGLIIISPDVDLTEPADPDWGRDN